MSSRTDLFWHAIADVVSTVGEVSTAGEVSTTGEEASTTGEVLGEVTADETVVPVSNGESVSGASLLGTQGFVNYN